MPYAEVNGVQLYYVLRGSGPTVVLSHGGWADHSMWFDVVGAMEHEFRFMLYDRRGCGQSHAPEDSHSAETWVADLNGLLDYLAIDRAVIGGQSYGALLTIEMLLAHPERALAALLVDGSPDGIQGSRPGLVPFPSRRADLHRIAVPTLIVHGSEDQAFPLSLAFQMRDAIPGSELAVIEGAGHTPNAEVPERFVEAVAPFLRRVTGVAAAG